MFIFDAKPFALDVAEKMGTYFGIKVEKLQFRLVDIRDENGMLIRLRIPFRDLRDLENDFFPHSPSLLEGRVNGNRLCSYLRKEVISPEIVSGGSLSRTLFLVHVCRWKTKGKCFLFTGYPVYSEALKRYALKYQVELFSLWSPFRIQWKRNAVLKYWYHLFFNWVWRIKYRVGPFLKRASAASGKDPKIAIDYYNLLNISQPEKYSDFSFYQQSEIKGSDILAFLYTAADPLDEERLRVFEKHRMEVLPLHFRATKVASHPPWIPTWKAMLRGSPPDSLARQFPEVKNLRALFSSYQWLYTYWRQLFQETNAKIYLSWHKYNGGHMAIADAIQEAGGVMGIYQRALDVTPFSECRLDVDFAFGYSKIMADLEKEQMSRIPYFIVTGYLGDHRFALLRNCASKKREEILQRGTKRIIAFTDENSAVDDRWHTGNRFMRENYDFLLEKLLQNPWLGLIIKPKVPSTLRFRLGPLAATLKRAEATGRCLVYEEGSSFGSCPPALAALSADVAIHGHLCAPTAPFECALAGVPTLMLDREGFPVSPLYDLGVGKVVFKSWEHLWETCLEHWQNHQGIQGFGDWSPMLDHFDPFRDGKASERMGIFLKWMLEDFKAGCNREAVMANAAERYCKQWGQDKVMAIH
ncbi:MAG: hypothetical protein HY466_06610 [Deltaproteobacteria bacterium]|nr:hypothetical protein [Deltaproteobacteria bacterium]